MDFTPFVNDAFDVAGLVLAAVVTAFIGRLATSFAARTGLQITQHEVDTVNAAVNTGANLLLGDLRAGVLAHADVKIGHPAVEAAVDHVFDSIPETLDALDVSETTVANKIIATVNLYGSFNVMPMTAKETT